MLMSELHKILTIARCCDVERTLKLRWWSLSLPRTTDFMQTRRQTCRLSWRRRAATVTWRPLVI